MKGLVVDDDTVNRLLVSRLLGRLGWSVDGAASGAEALSLFDRAVYDLVVLDISMPGMSGEEVCARIRQGPQGKSVPVVAYTAHAAEQDRPRFLAVGFTDLVCKPVSIAVISEMLGRTRVG